MPNYLGFRAGMVDGNLGNFGGGVTIRELWFLPEPTGVYYGFRNNRHILTMGFTLFLQGMTFRACYVGVR